MIKENESICVECDKKINDDNETRWNEHGEPVCKKCYTECHVCGEATSGELTCGMCKELGHVLENKTCEICKSQGKFKGGGNL